MITGTTEELLALILQRISPCPEVCDNVAPYGAGVYDIRTGLRMPELVEPPCYCYTMTTFSASTCEIEYINCTGGTTTFSQTGTTESVVDVMCIKKIINYSCNVDLGGTLVKKQVCGYGRSC